ncbi:MAG: cytochrome c1 [Alphaproteobacteria bacterium]|nr:cytochrome c1 [Alphaproteobacteria bacterium]MCB9974051.1 cytochrome c1 [Rhodospirillales bacterium]
MNATRFARLLALCALIGLAPLAVSTPSRASGGEEKPQDVQWSFDGPTGTYDRAALQRGYKIYREVCVSCHSMNLIYYRNLEALGYNEAQIKNIAGEYTYMDGPDDEGEMFERPGMPSDRFKAPFANAKQAAAANNGAIPPDLSLIAKARAGGPDYIFSLLTGYEEHAPHGHVLQNGQHWNRYMSGNVISMAPPLADGQVTYEDGTPQTLEQYARDISHFLMWAADPYMEQRKQTGLKVIIFLIVFAGIMYALKKKTWKDAH